MAFCKYCGRKLEENELCGCPESTAKRKEAESEEKTAADSEQVRPVMPVEDEDDEYDCLPFPPADPPEPETAPEPEKPEPVKESVPEKDHEKKQAKKEKKKDKKSRKEEAASEAAAPESHPIPDYYSEPFSSGKVKSPVPEKTKKKGGFLKGGLLFVLSVIALIALVILLLFMLGSSYKAPVNKIVSGINHCKSQRIIEAVIPEDHIAQLKSDVEADEGKWKDVTEDIDEYLSNVTDILKSNSSYEGKPKAEVKVIDKDKVKNSSMKEIRKYYTVMDEEVSKAYMLKIQVDYMGESGRVNVYTVKLKGSGWVLYTDEKTSDKLQTIFRDELDSSGKEIQRTAMGYSDTLGMFGWNDALDMLGIRYTGTITAVPDDDDADI